MPAADRIIIAAFALSGFCLFSAQYVSSQDSGRVLPSPKQVEYQKMELVGFIHFNMNTFTDKEWGYGDEDPKSFNPKNLDVEQWVRVAREAGMKELILTAKHHDGFCLWPSAYTKHSIRRSPYRAGKGDIVREFTDACHRSGVKAGLYLSPWDRNSAAYGTPAYIDYYKNQLRELLTHYGEISEVWFDGANGGDGYYGGARETRRIDSKTYYPWKEFADIVYRLQPHASIFSDAGPDLRWIGNEDGSAGETCWSTIDTSELIVGESNQRYLNTGDPEGKSWLVGICDVSIRPGWFYHRSQDTLVKSPRELVDLYYRSVGRNAVLLLNVPPNADGRISDVDARTLREFRQILNETFGNNLALQAAATASSSDVSHSAYKLVDGDSTTFWKAGRRERICSAEIQLPGVKEFDRIVLQEPIWWGQRISRFEIQARASGEWKAIAHGTTVGYKRILRTALIRADRVKVVIEEANNSPALSTLALYKSSAKE